LHTDLAGNELRRVDTTEVTGIAIDLAANRIYFGVSGAQKGRVFVREAARRLSVASIDPKLSM
jgi:hypothetical protein